MDRAQNSPEELSPLDWYRLFRSRIEHEDSLMVQRLSWLVASQAFLFTAFAVTSMGLNNLASPWAGNFPGLGMLLLRLIPLVAIFTAVLIYTSMLAALKAIRELRRGYQVKSMPHEWPPIQAGTATRLLGQAAPVLLPLLFITVWSVLLFHGPH